jgi:hypothetical protein
MTVIEAARPAAARAFADLPVAARPLTARPLTARPVAARPVAARPVADLRVAEMPVQRRWPTPVHRGRSAPVHRGRLVALAVGGFLLPWCVLLGMTLPSAAQAQHWSLAWTGLDGAEAVAALATAALLARGDLRAGLTAVAGGTLLLADAWLDVCTSAPGLGHALAVAEAVCVEIPLAGAAFWLALTLTRYTGPAARPPALRPRSGRGADCVR